MKIFKKYILQSHLLKVIPETSPWAALLIIPVIIISGAFWTSIPFYFVIATLWLFQRKTTIPWETGIALMGTTFFAVFVVYPTEYSYWVYTTKIIGCFIIVISLRPAMQANQRLWFDVYFVMLLGVIWETTAYSQSGRWSFDIIGNRYHPNFTAVYCYLFAMLAVRWRLPLSFLAALTMGWLTGSRNFALALGFVGLGYMFFPVLRWIFSKTSRTIVLYLFLAGFSLWALEQITTGQWPGLHFFGERILRFTADPGRQNWNLNGLHEWTKTMQSFAWGVEGWPLHTQNPHNSLLHTFLERGFVATLVVIIFLLSDLRKHARGMEPWILGWFMLGMYVHLIYVSMYWVIAILIIRCRFVKNGVDVQEDVFVEWLLIKWKIVRLRLASS
jgi:hypothetical protein